jgi:predicted nucleotidyltransferase
MARDKANPLSDLDVAVFFKNDLTQEQMGKRQIEITCNLMSLFKINNVDVTILNLASPFLRFQVLKYGKLLKCVEKNEFFSFKSNAMGRYQDIKPMYDLYARAAIQNLQRGPHD